ncbi:hypothetical protein HBI56_073690 [Parastagonospora nodorum]|uniref:Heme haloperoxidase family profile domain-containing protein n=2 Tax=Phaeosphaeria nodorum (strain SN15 / ATCC MYA-4574 / FGSC 10173) TaxID=321614 RepID=A0A7U2I064_PHANO|nr:hypothetical protein SNOG_07745 [Parastagonospora nodorum SN15]KAH3908726.1 hypothetical protein HBH56_171290 [Parastagonospora nodorum]EAT85211.1 hypothetical protein SNOG_07745 [Parastagonospora nodorum SN15]KAH3928495.1 hypothetical protein HBH54_139850 [Parastagonospora nodorum]KAH3945392.1 hypothetical protein HBH53_145200 [Parastagonospora nodorum]KAH3983924.1 hypothetical protein HBH52_059020 [Parastagonospora nodorum]
MRLSSIVLMGASSLAAAQDMSLCDKYTTALLKENNATNQYTLLTLLVNTVVIGNYTQPNMNAVPGILAKGMYMDKEVNLLPYFDGTLKSSNRGGSSGVSINFLDDGGAAPLMKNMPANSEKSNQYFLLTHLYQFFGKLLGCSAYGNTGFPAYTGHSMEDSHRFMNLDPSEMGYFITQVGLAATSFGVSKEDVTTVAEALTKLFNYRCSPAATVIPEQGPTLNSICQNEQCPLDPMAQCSAYPNNGTVMEPMAANASMTSSASGSSAKPSSTMTGAPGMFTGGASSAQVGVGAVVGLAALAMVL